MHNDPPRTCVIKEGRRDSATDPAGRDIRTQLAKQYEILRSLSDDGLAPQPYRLFEQEGNSYLVMEHIEEETLESMVTEAQGEGRRLSAEYVAEIGVRIAENLERLHNRGWLYRDMTPSNVMLGAKRAYLIDFELAHRLDDRSPAFGWGTPGYTSPQQADLEDPAIADDMFSLGASLYFALTGSDPAYIEDSSEREQAIRLFRPNDDPALARIVAHMMDHDVHQRPKSMSCAVRELNRATATNTPASDAQLAPSVKELSRRSRYRELASQAGNRLLEDARTTDYGVRWLSRAMNFQSGVVGGMHLPREERYALDLHNGLSGIALFLLRLWTATADHRYLEAAQQAAATALHDSQKGVSLPGLHFGRAGICTFLAELADSLSDPTYSAHATAMARSLDADATPIPDVTHGLAGIGLMHLRLGELGSEEHAFAPLRSATAC